MKYIERIKNGIKILSSPKEEYVKMDKRTFEDILEDYIKLLLLSGLFAGIVSFLIDFSRALYLNIFKNITIDFYKLANYSLGTTTNIFFSYIFLGIVFLAILTGILKLFARKIKYVKLVSVVLYALTPVLLFGWIHSILSLTLLAWTVFLTSTGISTINELNSNKKKTKK